MPKIIKKKAKKVAAREDENVKELLNETKDFVNQKKSFLLPLAAIAVVSVVVIVGFLAYRSSNIKKAETLEYEAYKIFYDRQNGMPGLQKAGEQYNKALDAFRKAYNTRKSAGSLFYIAGSYYNAGKYDDALKTLKELNEKFPDDERFVPLSYYKMALISLKKGDNDAALKFLDALHNYRTGSFKDLAIIESAKILEAMGKTDDAGKKFAELAKDFPNSPFAAEALARQGVKTNH